MVVQSCPCQGTGRWRSTLRADVDRYLVLAELDQGGPGSLIAKIRAWTFYPGLYGVLAYRLSHAAKTAALPGPLSTLLTTVTIGLQQLLVPRTGVELSARAHIGPGLFINHAQGVVVADIEAGSNLTLSHNATLGEGTRAGAGRRDTPTLGDRVWVGVGAVVAGGVELGDDAMIGANSVVTRDVPACGVAVGAPARVVSQQGSFDNVLYRGMADDPGRRAALAAAATRVDDVSLGT